jgi:hypothetical protein
MCLFTPPKGSNQMTNVSSSMNPELESQDSALQRLIDKDALGEIALRYVRATDRVDPELLGTVYHADAIDDHGVSFAGPASEFIARFPELMAPFELTHHRLSNCSYRIDGDRADGELYFNAYHRTKPPEPRHLISQGRYLDNYERRDGVWKVAHRRVVWDSVLILDVTDADTAMLHALGVVGAHADDRSYEALQLMRRGG